MSLKKHQRYIGYIQLRGTWPSVHKGNSKSEISLLKIFSPKQTKKQIKYSQLLQKKSNFVSSKKKKKQSMFSLDIDKGLQWRYVKRKPFRKIQLYFDIFWHILTYSGISSHIQELFWHIDAYLEPFVILAYLEPWYIQNEKVFRANIH